MTDLEPFLPVISPIVTAAIETIKGRRAAALDLYRSHLEGAADDLEQAMIIMAALESETDGILLSAMRIQSLDEGEAIVTRMDELLYQETLRPELIRTLGRLEAFRAGGALGQDAASDFDVAVDYVRNYLHWLQYSGLAGGSGPLVAELHAIRQFLTQYDLPSANRAAQTALQARVPMNLNRDRQMSSLIHRMRMQCM